MGLMKENHIKLLAFPHIRGCHSKWETIDKILNESCNTKNVDWYIEEDYWGQCSYVQYTVHKDYVEKACKALNLEIPFGYKKASQKGNDNCYE